MLYVMWYKTMWYEYDDDMGAVQLLGMFDLFDDDDDVFWLWRWCGNSAAAQFRLMIGDDVDVDSLVWHCVVYRVR